MRRQFLLILIIGAGCMGLQAAQQQVDPSHGLTLKNHYVRLEFEPRGMTGAR